ncbi:enoyl-CoA hydratase/isomerase family protein [Hahella sp. HN01]|nr:enoyl-CoA hydratase/isomerase family protein [Hahella sp. HN01]
MEESGMSEKPVLFEERECSDGHRIGVITLNVEKSLNALKLSMIESMYSVMQEWRLDDKIVAVFMQGAGDKAFCAGGDIVQMYESMCDAGEGPPAYAEEFFTREYRLDYLIHVYPKPVVCWGNGIVMGGGLGLMAGASHRIVTESSRIAMPEVTIGLFPDVGGTWFLNRMPDGAGLYLGLTGAACNAADALELGWADGFLPHAQKEAFLQALTRTSWSSPESNHTRVTQLLRSWNEQHQSQRPGGQVAQHRAMIKQVTQGDSVTQVVDAILNYPTVDEWVGKAQKSLRNGCPTTAHLVWRQIHEGGGLSLPDVFKRELIMAVQCTMHPEFREGVRALLIDKDFKPQWRYPSFADVPEAWVDEFFSSPWDISPLHDLAVL